MNLPGRLSFSSDIYYLHYTIFFGGGAGVRKMKAGYFIYDNKVNNLFFMVDVKNFSKNEKEMNSLVSATQVISKDISRESGF